MVLQNVPLIIIIYSNMVGYLESVWLDVPPGSGLYVCVWAVIMVWL